jgi:hypothetical protein
MKVEEVKRQVSGQAFELRAIDGKPAQYTLVPDYTLEVHGVIPTVLFVLEMEFNQTGLCRVTLKLDQGKGPDGKARDTMMLATFLPQELHDALNAKYGRPVNSEGPCDNSDLIGPAGVPERHVWCETTWRDSGQQIKSFWGYSSVFRQVEIPIPGKSKTKREMQHEQIFTYSIDYRPQLSGL